MTADDVADLAHRQGISLGVDDLDLGPGERASDRSRALQPFMRGAGGDRAHFGAAVNFVNDGAPPFAHLALDMLRARCRSMDHETQRTDLEPLAPRGRLDDRRLRTDGVKDLRSPMSADRDT